MKTWKFLPCGEIRCGQRQFLASERCCLRLEEAAAGNKKLHKCSQLGKNYRRKAEEGKRDSMILSVPRFLGPYVVPRTRLSTRPTVPKIWPLIYHQNHLYKGINGFWITRRPIKPLCWPPRTLKALALFILAFPSSSSSSSSPSSSSLGQSRPTAGKA